MARRLPAVLLVVLLLWLVLFAPRTSAHGIGRPQAINVVSGPYLLSVWSDPDPLRVDQTHLVVAVMDPETREPLLEDVAVAVRLEIPGEPNSTQSAAAESDNTANQLLYVVQFSDLPSTGQWQATVVVDGSRGLADDLTFPLQISPPQRYSWIQVGLVGLVVVTFGWLFLAMLQASAYATRDTAAARRRAFKHR